MGAPVFKLSDLKGAEVKGNVQYPALGEPEGEVKAYRAFLAEGCPRDALHVAGVPFVKKRYKPFTAEGPDQEIPNLVYLADNQLAKLTEKRVAKRIQVKVDLGREDEMTGERMYAFALVPVSNWVRLARHVPVPVIEGWDDGDEFLVEDPARGRQADAQAEPEAGEAVEATGGPQLACEHCDYETPIGSGNPRASLAAHQRQKHREAVAQ